MCVQQVVCQACSANKYYLEYLKNQPARVCDHCFAKLQENSEYRGRLRWITSSRMSQFKCLEGCEKAKSAKELRSDGFII